MEPRLLSFFVIGGLISDIVSTTAVTELILSKLVFPFLLECWHGKSVYVCGAE